jgi:RNA polymerase sigma-70 factor (ECF subfamily)
MAPPPQRSPRAPAQAQLSPIEALRRQYGDRASAEADIDAEQSSDGGPADDDRLLKACQRGDEQALCELIRRYQKRLYRLTLRVCGEAALAEEATVESFYKIWVKARQWRGESGPEAWIYRIAVRTVLDLRRSRRRWRTRVRRAQAANDPQTQPDASEEVVAAERHERISAELAQAIETLKAEDRALIHLYYFEGRGLKEIAPILEATSDALKMRLSRARQRLRQMLEDFHDE